MPRLRFNHKGEMIGGHWTAEQHELACIFVLRIKNRRNLRGENFQGPGLMTLSTYIDSI